MGVQNISEGDPLSKVTLGIQWGLSKDGPPQEKVEVRRDPPNLCLAQEPAAFSRLPLARDAPKKSPRTSLRTNVTTGNRSFI